MSQPKRIKFPDECVITLTFFNGKTKQFVIHKTSDVSSWHLSPMMHGQLGIKPDSIVFKYRDGSRIHFPLENIESYHVQPQNKLSGKGEDAKAPSAVHD